MSVPPEILQRMTQQGAPGAGGPQGSPNAQPQEKAGLKAHAATNINIAQNMLEQAITAYHPGDKEYKAILKCLTALEPLSAKDDSSDLVPAEVMRMVQGLPQAGGGTDVQKMIMQMMQKGGQTPPQGQPQQPQVGM